MKQWILFLLLILPSLMWSQGDAQFVWPKKSGKSRLQLAYFRTAFTLTDSVEQAQIHLFADSRYHLLVNGQFLNFGPARFYPENPEYDSYDLRPYLQAGENVIAVKVMSNGVSTFQLRVNPPAFIAWGTVKTAQKSIDLASPGPWKAHRSDAYHTDATRMTFALGPMEIYDARKDQAIKGWELANFDDSAWSKPMMIKNAGNWGKLRPRSIPPLTQQAFSPHQLLGHYKLLNEEDLYSFQVLKPDRSWNEFRATQTFVGYTYIHSPQKQTVQAGLWWGEHYINGKAIRQEAAPADQPHRQTATIPLEEGWNLFFVKRKTFMGKWAFIMALPKAAQLKLSPNKLADDDRFFATIGPFDDEAPAIERLDPLQVPKALPGTWTFHSGSEGGNPAIEMAWQYFGEQVPHPSGQLEGITIEGMEGNALLYDFRFKKLGRIIVEYEAPSGTIFDLATTEDLVGKQANVMKRIGLYMANRHIAAGGKGRIETFKPYGLRYLQINIRNNNGPVKIKKVQVANQIYPFEQIGNFSCSDPLFNDLWALGWRTLQVCAEDSYTDTPFRERGLYAGDMLPQMGITMAGSGDLALVKRSLLLFQDMYKDQFQAGAARHPDEIDLLEDYPLLTLEALSWYVDRSRDLAFAQKLFPAYEHLLHDWLAKRDEQGLIQNNKVFIEWTQIEKSQVKNMAFHAMLARANLLLSRLAKQLGYHKKSTAFNQYYHELATAINTHFWDSKLGRYFDGIKDGQPIEHSYPISNAWAYIAGITTTEQDHTLFPYLLEVLQDIGSTSRQRKATPYGSFYLLAALYDQGHTEAAESFIRKHWGPMVWRHDDTAWENFDDHGNGTLSHAWSAAPTYYFTTQILGVDFNWLHPSNELHQLIIAPQTESIQWAKGSVPHPAGPVQVHWKIDGPKLWVEVEAPKNLQYSVQPRGKLGELKLWVNGKRK